MQVSQRKLSRMNFSITILNFSREREKDTEKNSRNIQEMIKDWR